MVKWYENSKDTRGFASCDKCHPEKGDRNPSGRTWQNGKTTLCLKHFSEMINTNYSKDFEKVN